MKKALLAFLMVFLVISGAAAQDRTGKESTDSTIVSMLDKVRSDSLQSYVQSLQDFGTRFMIAPNRKEVATWIMEKFISFGLTEVRLDSFTCYTHVNAPPYFVFDTTTWQYNVEARITGTQFPTCELVMMAHYDDCVNESDPMVAAPGADDNASGVAALLECARVISDTGYQPGKTFIFLATAAEELMLVSESGAMHYAQEAAEDGRDISMVLNNDMISWNDSSWSIRIFNDINSEITTGLAVHVIDTYSTLDLTFDNMGTFADLTFFLEEGYEGVYFMESAQNGFTPYYHTVYDLVENIDTSYLAEMTRVDLGCFLLSDLLKNDAVLAGISNVPEKACSGMLSPFVKIYNNGSDTLTSIGISCAVNGESLVVEQWIGSLAFGAAMEVELDPFPFSLLAENELEITLENVNGIADELGVNNTKSISFGMADATPEELKLKIRLDAHPEETSWDFKDMNGGIIFSGGPYATPNALVDEIMLFDEPGCYSFSVYDAGGDGIQSGFVLLYSGVNEVILQVMEFGSLVQTQFDVGGTMQTEEFDQSGEIGFYPNPVCDVGYITFSPSVPAMLEVVVCNPLGQKVLELPGTIYPPGPHLVSLPVSHLHPGLYILEVRSGKQVKVFKMIRESIHP
ncbi:MAG: M20/M25/M40 family metallo-hydrolase [Bacteroidales bacterium]|jgi:hypothetical protein|nr:M20/M25/M40 family metallo-hydrolase [Bacteroidales bacterium]